MLIDTHAHLNFKAFSGDFNAAITRAKEAKVNKIIIVGSNFKTSKKAIEIAKKYTNTYATIGLHPIYVKDESFDANFKRLAENDKVVAIGETGLDYYYDKTAADTQKEVFREHIKLAQQLSKPLILHNRDAGEDILSILTSISNLPTGVMHCFSEGLEYAKVILSMGFYLSFTGIITFTKNYEIFRVIENMPLNKIIIETDSPYLAPDPYRGKRNEPAYVLEIAKKIAEIKKINIEEVAKQTSDNANKLFKLN